MDYRVSLCYFFIVINFRQPLQNCFEVITEV